jgi:hypothetical protein
VSENIKQSQRELAWKENEKESMKDINMSQRNYTKSQSELKSGS